MKSPTKKYWLICSTPRKKAPQKNMLSRFISPWIWFCFMLLFYDFLNKKITKLVWWLEKSPKKYVYSHCGNLILMKNLKNIKNWWYNDSNSWKKTQILVMIWYVPLLEKNKIWWCGCWWFVCVSSCSSCCELCVPLPSIWCWCVRVNVSKCRCSVLVCHQYSTSV